MAMTRKLRMGTRDSILATRQSRYVGEMLEKAGYATELRFIKTEGDRVLDTPLPLMGGKGVFTRALDEALLAGEIDLAVHSLKDIPTRIPEGLILGAVSEREDPSDVLVIRRHMEEKRPMPFRESASDRETVSGEERVPAGKKVSGPLPAAPEFVTEPRSEAVIASSSNRRIGQWLARYPNHRIADIRGNIQTRLRKLWESDWDGAVFAAAGLNRLGLADHIHCVLDWMVPAPAQGALGVMVREDDKLIREAVLPVHDPDTALCTAIERDVLHSLEGGCRAPVGALAVREGGRIRLEVNIVYPDGTGLISLEITEQRERAADLGKRAAEEAWKRGADALIRDLRSGKTIPGPGSRQAEKRRGNHGIE